MPGGVDFFASEIICMILGSFMFGIEKFQKIFLCIFGFFIFIFVFFGIFMLAFLCCNYCIHPILGPTEPLKTF